MANIKLSLTFAALAAFGATGCSTTIRSMTATAWIAPTSAPAPAAPVIAGAPAPGEAAPATPAAGGLASQYYVTYWEGHCKPLLGCGRGETHVKRCKVAADNSVICVEEAQATAAMAAD